MKKAWGTSDVCQFFVTVLADFATKPRHFHCRICRRDVSFLTHGDHEILQHIQGRKQLPRDHCLRLETPGWEALDYQGNAISPAEVERHRERIMRAPLVARDRQYSFSEDVFVDETGAVDPILGIMAKVCLSLKCCIWAEVTNCCTSSGRNLLYPLPDSTWIIRGHATRSW